MKKTVVIPVALLYLFLVAVPILAAGPILQSGQQSAELVAGLNIGLGDYIIGKTLSQNQKTKALANLQNEAYAGTYKFQVSDFFVVAAEDTDMILAIHKQYNDSAGKDFQEIVSTLMNDFGEPTVMAHEKTIYWAYDKNGKITEDKYQQAKKAGKLESILTVKLNSSEEIQAVVATIQGDLDVTFTAAQPGATFTAAQPGATFTAAQPQITFS